MKLDVLFPYILPEVQGCPDPLLRRNILLAAIDFCRETLSWTEFQDPIPLLDDVQDYELDVPSGAYVLNVRDVWIGNRRLYPKTMQALHDAMPNWASSYSNEPSYYNQAVDRGSLRLYPMPRNVGTTTFIVRAAYTPTVTATTLPDYLGDRHMDILANGVKGRLMMMPAVAWSNPQLGAYYTQLFNDGIVKIRVDEMHDRVIGSVTVGSRRFGF